MAKTTAHSQDYSAMSLAEGLLRAHEGLVLKPYLCTSGKTTIGIGRNLTDKGISEAEAHILLSHDLTDTRDFLVTQPYWQSLDPHRKSALLDLAFCVGPAGFMKFKKLREALINKEYDRAGNEIIDSRFAQQTGNRATELARIIKLGF